MSYSSNEYDFVLQIYEPPLQYHYLKRPYELVPLSAHEVPEPKYYGRDGRLLGEDPPEEEVAKAVYTIRIREGIRYQDHPCFARDSEGRYLYRELTQEALADIRTVTDFPASGSRELVAADYVHQIKRLAHPGLDCPILSLMATYIAGLRTLALDLAAEYERMRARRPVADGVPCREGRCAGEAILDLDSFPLEGAQVLDRYTYEIVLNRKYPQFVYWLAMPFFAPVPPEADAFFSQAAMVVRNLKLDNSPVGTGAFRMETYLPNRRIVLTRNENFHGETYPTEGEPGDRAQGLLADAGLPLPFIERAAYQRETEAIPRWNKFLQGYYDSSWISNEVFDQALQLGPTGRLAPSEQMSARGVRMLEDVLPSTTYFAFNMLDDVVGGNAEQSRKLRQAVAIAVDIEEWIQIFDNGLGIPSQNLIPPGIFGHAAGREGMNSIVYKWDAAKSKPLRRPISEARRLLAEAGYPEGRDRHGRPLVLHFDTYWTGAWAKSRIDWLRKQFAQINIDLQIRQTDYNRFQDKVRGGNFQILAWGWNADYPDPENFLFLLYGPNARTHSGGENVANYDNPEFNRLFRRLETMANGPERLKLIREATAIAQRDAPLIWGYHPVSFGLIHSWYYNAKPAGIGGNTLKYVRVEPLLRDRLRQDWNQPVWWPLAAFTALIGVALLPAAWRAWRQQRGEKGR